jgi:hypothetical protein
MLIVIDKALLIGEANNLSVYVDGASKIDEMPSNEWILVWGTIQRLASTVPAYAANTSAF